MGTKKDAGEEIEKAGDAPVMILFDIPDNGGFYVKTGAAITTESIGEFIAQKEDGSAKKAVGSMNALPQHNRSVRYLLPEWDVLTCSIYMRCPVQSAVRVYKAALE